MAVGFPTSGALSVALVAFLAVTIGASALEDPGDPRWYLWAKLPWDRLVTLSVLVFRREPARPTRSSCPASSFTPGHLGLRGVPSPCWW